MAFTIARPRVLKAQRVRAPARGLVRVRADAPNDKDDGAQNTAPAGEKVKAGEDTVRGGEEQLDVKKASQAAPDDVKVSARKFDCEPGP